MPQPDLNRTPNTDGPQQARPFFSWAPGSAFRLTRPREAGTVLAEKTQRPESRQVAMSHQPLEETARRNGDEKHVKLRAPSTHESVELLTDRVCGLLCEAPIQDSARFRLRMAIHEALTNAVEHGNHGDPAKQVTVTCAIEPSEVRITIDDEGNGFDPEAVPDPTEEENLLKEGGRGIFLIHRYADECRFENNGRRLVLIKHVP